MSLVEVIISITILSIVVVPVLQAMTSAMVYNSKARTRQSLTLTAESIMETFKGNDLKSLVDMFKGTGIEGIKFKKASEGEESAEDKSGHYIVTPESIDDKNQKYTFEIKDFVDNGEKYDATITLTPKGTTTVKVLEMSDSSSLNDAVYIADKKDYAEGYSNISEAIYNEAFLTAPDDTVKAGYVRFFEEFVSAPYDLDGNPIYKVDKNGNKTTEPAEVMVNVDDKSSDGKKIESADDVKGLDIMNNIKIYDRTLTIEINDGKVTASLEYRYFLDNFSFYTAYYPEEVKDTYLDYLDEGETDTTADDETVSLGEQQYARFPKAGSGDDKYLVYKVNLANADIYTGTGVPDRLYIYYYPEYELDPGKDKIVINNNTNTDKLECYIMKQKTGEIGEASLSVEESDYYPSVTCNKKSATQVTLYHNFNTNISDAPSKTNPSGFGMDSSGFVDGGDIAKENITTNKLEANKNFVEEEVLQYDITVEIKKGEKTVSVLTSSKNEKISTDKETKKSTLTDTDTETKTDTESSGSSEAEGES
jgi:type II secretory pathway pseudopilin PulG